MVWIWDYASVGCNLRIFWWLAVEQSVRNILSSACSYQTSTVTVCLVAWLSHLGMRHYHFVSEMWRERLAGCVVYIWVVFNIECVVTDNGGFLQTLVQNHKVFVFGHLGFVCTKDFGGLEEDCLSAVHHSMINWLIEVLRGRRVRTMQEVSQRASTSSSPCQ